MATQKDKERKLPPTGPTPARNTTKDSNVDAPAGKDPDTYDPVGMAGKKAGIVVEVEEQLRQKGTATGQDKPARSGGGKAKV